MKERGSQQTKPVTEYEAKAYVDECEMTEACNFDEPALLEDMIFEPRVRCVLD